MIVTIPIEAGEDGALIITPDSVGPASLVKITKNLHLHKFPFAKIRRYLQTIYVEITRMIYQEGAVYHESAFKDER